MNFIFILLIDVAEYGGGGGSGGSTGTTGTTRKGRFRVTSEQPAETTVGRFRLIPQTSEKSIKFSISQLE